MMAMTGERDGGRIREGRPSSTWRGNAGHFPVVSAALLCAPGRATAAASNPRGVLENAIACGILTCRPNTRPATAAARRLGRMAHRALPGRRDAGRSWLAGATTSAA